MKIFRLGKLENESNFNYTKGAEGVNREEVYGESLTVGEELKSGLNNRECLHFRRPFKEVDWGVEEDTKCNLPLCQFLIWLSKGLMDKF